MILDDYLDRLRAGLKRLPAGERDAVVEEVRHHLQDEAADLHKNETGLSHMDALRRAIDNFGPAEEVAAGYDEASGEVRRPDGEVLRVTKAVGRGAGRAAVGVGRGVGTVLKWSLIGVLALTGIAAVVAVAALFFAGDVADTFQDDIREAIPRPLYDYERSWSGTTEAHSSTTTDSFDLREGTKEFHISFDVRADTGCARVILLDPGGATRYDSDTVCGEATAGRTLVFSTPGQWRIQYTYTAFTGSVEVGAWYFQEA